MSEWKDMELRDYFAGQALVGMLPSQEMKDAADALELSVFDMPDFLAVMAYQYADAMLKVKAQPPISEDI